MSIGHFLIEKDTNNLSQSKQLYIYFGPLGP